MRLVARWMLGSFMALAAGQAAAENRTFIIASSPDGYGVDQCLVTGARCGTLIANAYCQSRDYDKAVSFRRVDAGEVTGSVAETNRIALSEPSGAFVAIECAR
ncbi:MAG TPA: hypothetical protein VGD16_11955 [Enterovirga sp.]|jgi:hypothetical protein